MEARAEEVNALVKSAVDAMTPVETPAERMASLIKELGGEDTGAKQCVYLGTLSRVLPETLAQADNLVDVSGLSRQEVGEAVRKAFDNPLQGAAGGRPVSRTDGIVKKVVVFKEAHADGAVHFHVAVALLQPRSWAPAKRTLRERDHLASHWSCCHTQWWSAARYGAIPSLKKPVVDDDPWTRTKDGSEIDLFAESQRPFCAKLWKRRREEAELQAAAGAANKKRRFSKLDLTALILDRNLKTKATVLEYVQDFGTEEMQNFVHNHQGKLKDFIADALEWDEARATAQAERETDWVFMCRTADGACPHGDACPYAQAAKRFFEKNSNCLSRLELATALRSIVMCGPSKTTRTPLIVGPTNTGKSTLLLPFDHLFGFKKVFHKPALGSKCAERLQPPTPGPPRPGRSAIQRGGTFKILARAEIRRLQVRVA